MEVGVSEISNEYLYLFFSHFQTFLNFFSFFCFSLGRLLLLLFIDWI